MERNYYLMGGYDFEIRRDIFSSPSTLVKYAENGKLQAEINGKVILPAVVLGRSDIPDRQSIIVMAGVSVDKLIFGYAFDIGLNSIMKYSYGTHEFTFIAKFGDNARRYRWLNVFSRLLETLGNRSFTDKSSQFADFPFHL